MFRHILVPVDDRHGSGNAVRHAQHLSRLLGSRLSFVHVVCATEHDPETLEAARALLERAAIGSRFTPGLLTVLAGYRSVPACILEVARNANADLIVIGARGSHDARRVTLGSVSLSVASAAEIPVQIVPLTESPSFKFEDRWRRATR